MVIVFREAEEDNVRCHALIPMLTRVCVAQFGKVFQKGAPKIRLPDRLGILVDFVLEQVSSDFFIHT